MIHGVINIYKEKGFTSHDVVAKLRGILGQKKIGHTGTLDPDAVGVLPVCLGKATKLCDMLTDKDKTYETVLLLGKTTDTQDTTGTVLEERAADDISEEALRECILGFAGAYSQIPPMYSALKVNGKKLYELAREGKEIERKPRAVFIHEIRILEMKPPRVRMEVTCSKGTYIRTLCHDIGAKMGCGGCMEELIRTRVSCFSIKESLTLSEAAKKKDEDTLGAYIKPVDAMFPDYPKVTAAAKYESLLYNGNPLKKNCLKEREDLKDGAHVRVYDEAGRFIGIYFFVQKENALKIRKMFFDKEELYTER